MQLPFNANEKQDYYCCKREGISEETNIYILTLRTV